MIFKTLIFFTRGKYNNFQITFNNNTNLDTYITLKTTLDMQNSMYFYLNRYIGLGKYLVLKVFKNISRMY